MNIELYTFEDAKGHEFGSYSTTSAEEAKEYGEKHNLRVIANTFTFDDSELAWDFTRDE